VRAALVHRADGQTDMTKLIGAFGDDASTSTNKYGGPTACRRKRAVVQQITKPRVKNYSFLECFKYLSYQNINNLNHSRLRSEFF